MHHLLLRGGSPWRSDEPADLLIRDGAIAQIRPGIAADGAEVVDIPGRLVLPGLIDAHCHLDKTLYGGPWVPHSAGDALEDRIGNDRRRRGELGIPDVDRITALLETMVAAGTTHVRSHTDIDPETVEPLRAGADRLHATQPDLASAWSRSRSRSTGC
jgi:cytosine deaminase